MARVAGAARREPPCFEYPVNGITQPRSATNVSMVFYVIIVR